MQSNSLFRQRNLTLAWEWSNLANISLYGLLYAGLTLLAYILPTGEFLLRPGAALLLAAGALYGPLVGFGAGLLGGLITDLAQNMLWIHWDIGLGVMGAIFGLFTMWKQDSDTVLAIWVKLAALAVIGSFVGMFLAGFVDLLFGAPAVIAFYAWALPSSVINSLFAAVFGPLFYLLLSGKIYTGRRRIYWRK